MAKQRIISQVLACFALAISSGLALAQDRAFELPRSEKTVVLEYHLDHHLIADRDPQPLLRIFADGRVRVHHPVYTPRAGDYEMRLSKAELFGLLERVAQIGILDFNAAAVKAERQQVVAADRAVGWVYHISDVSETQIDVRLRSYKAPGSKAPVSNFKASIRWPNVEPDAERFTGVAGIQALAQAEQLFRTVINRPDLVKVAGGSK